MAGYGLGGDVTLGGVLGALGGAVRLGGRWTLEGVLGAVSPLRRERHQIPDRILLRAE